MPLAMYIIPQLHQERICQRRWYSTLYIYVHDTTTRDKVDARTNNGCLLKRPTNQDHWLGRNFDWFAILLLHLTKKLPQTKVSLNHIQRLLPSGNEDFALPICFFTHEHQNHIWTTQKSQTPNGLNFSFRRLRRASQTSRRWLHAARRVN